MQGGQAGHFGPLLDFLRTILPWHNAGEQPEYDPAAPVDLGGLQQGLARVAQILEGREAVEGPGPAADEDEHWEA